MEPNGLSDEECLTFLHLDRKVRFKLLIFLLLVARVRETAQFGAPMVVAPSLKRISTSSTASFAAAGRQTIRSMASSVSSTHRAHLKPELEQYVLQLLNLAESERVGFLCKPVYAPMMKLNDPFLEMRGVQVFMKREDMIDEHISGNKWRKLKYNILHAVHTGCEVKCK
eukprot:752188-Hanusia_phi.AAC.3